MKLISRLWQTLTISMVSIIFMAFSGAIVSGAQIEEETPAENFEYAITPDDPHWEQLECVEDKIAACRIQKDVLQNMTNEQLLDAVLNFPFRCEIFYYSSREEGVENLEKISDAYAELIRREDAKDTLIETINQRRCMRTTLTTKEELDDEILVTIILYQKSFQNILSLEEVEDIAGVSTMIDIEVIDENSDIDPLLAYTITTPKGSVVPYLTMSCNHSNEDFHMKEALETANAFGVTVISPGSCKYNCHSYAWFNQSENNSYWINDPSAYMTDGSYNRVMSGTSTSSISAVLGDRVFYGTTSNPTHSALINSSATGVPLATRIVKSKWGASGVFSHTVLNVPSGYDCNNVSVWRR